MDKSRIKRQVFSVLQAAREGRDADAALDEAFSALSASEHAAFQEQLLNAMEWRTERLKARTRDHEKETKVLEFLLAQVDSLPTTSRLNAREITIEEALDLITGAERAIEDMEAGIFDVQVTGTKSNGTGDCIYGSESATLLNRAGELAALVGHAMFTQTLRDCASVCLARAIQVVPDPIEFDPAKRALAAIGSGLVAHRDIYGEEATIIDAFYGHTKCEASAEPTPTKPTRTRMSCDEANQRVRELIKAAGADSIKFTLRAVHSALGGKDAVAVGTVQKTAAWRALAERKKELAPAARPRHIALGDLDELLEDRGGPIGEPRRAPNGNARERAIGQKTSLARQKRR